MGNLAVDPRGDNLLEHIRARPTELPHGALLSFGETGEPQRWPSLLLITPGRPNRAELEVAQERQQISDRLRELEQRQLQAARRETRRQP